MSLPPVPFPAWSSTARPPAVDVSRGAPRASGRQAGPGTDCACGGVILAASGEAADIERAVQLHNASLVHAIWRNAREDGPPDRRCRSVGA